MVAVVFFAGGILTSLAVDDADTLQEATLERLSALEEARFSVEFQRGKLSVIGATASVAHERSLAQQISAGFADQERTLHFRPLIVAPSFWANSSRSLLELVATTHSAAAYLTESAVHLRGVTADNSLWSARLAALRAELPQNISIDIDVLVVASSTEKSALCLQAFSSLRNARIGFRQSSSDIRTSSFAALDAIVSITYDCDDMNIAITGHSDSSGNEATNQRLSLLRAQSVARYLETGGVARERLLVTGAGSLLPIDDNTNAAGRSRNRRIEFELLPAMTQAAR